MTTNKDKVISVIQSLLEKTEKNGCTKAEVESSVAKISALLLKYNLDISEVEDVTYSSKIYEEEVQLEGKVTPNWVKLLFGIVAEYSFCKVLSNRYATKMTFIGRSENTKVAKMITSSLMISLKSMALRETGKYADKVRSITGDDPGKLKGTNSITSWRISYLFGCVQGINFSLEKQRIREQAINQKVTSLVIHHDAEITDYVSKVYPKVEYSSDRISHHFNTDALMRGINDGERIPIPFTTKELESKDECRNR